MRHIEADDSVVAGGSAVLEQRGTAAKQDLILARPTVDGCGPAATDYSIIAATAVDRVGAAAANDRIVSCSGSDRLRSAASDTDSTPAPD